MLKTFRFLVGFIVVLCLGCGEADNGRVAVSGSVLQGDQAVQMGSIAFRPTAGTSGPAAGTDIRDGRYQISKTRGPATGSYKVRITVVHTSESTRPLAGKGGGAAEAFEQEVTITADQAEYDFTVEKRRSGDSRRQQLIRE